MYWYNPTTRTSERAAAPADDEGAVRMLAGHPDSAAFVTEYAELRRSGAPIERALVTVGHRERLRRHEHAALWLASPDRPTKPRPSAEGYELLLAVRLREKGEGRSLLGRPASGTPSKNVAVVERDGAIVAVNGGWRAFARENGGDPVKVSEGANYLAVCDGARDDQSGVAPPPSPKRCGQSSRAESRTTRSSTRTTRRPNGAGTSGRRGLWSSTGPGWRS